jgi:hypothetical protein
MRISNPDYRIAVASGADRGLITQLLALREFGSRQI